ncbi:uncharacterized protein LOC119399890 isoform X2 [Rhipicephalus sanguineus]|uniref:uncharacterized protein LOC119399890 isoform X2 n=1 Tax=Rhipicephalus sanguineus TaxID=34632 RepID=UPI0020C1C266|nr:uncharacterized protein LOC119399890 isoform X2 [Rhipicephalus sanguineus]
MALSYAFAGLLVLAAMTSVVTASTSTSCVNVTINNILNISTCLGSNLNYCTGSTSASGLVTGLVRVLTCVLQGIYNYGSPQGVVNALGPLLSLIVSRLSLPSVNLPVLGNTSNVNFLTRNDTCQGPLTIQLPGLQNVSSCLGNTANICTAGSTTTTAQVTQLVQTLTCLLSQIPLDQFRQVIMGIGCQLITILSALARDASLGLTLQTALGSFSTALRLIVPTCSTTG